MIKSVKNGKGTKTIAAMTIAAALASALSLGTAMPALADEASANLVQQQATTQSDAAADESAWDATADENGFAADATNTYAAELGANQNDIAGVDGNSWWWRHVSPNDALSAAENYFSIWNFGDWNYQVGRYRGTPAYRIEIDGVDDYAPWGQRVMNIRSVAFVNYFTGEVIDGYSENLG